VLESDPCAFAQGPNIGFAKSHSDFGREPRNHHFATITIIEALMAICHNKVS
jgi:hypothetical protein